MDPRLIDLYNEELLHLRTEAAEFAREYPDRAGRLALDQQRVEDPYVERLLEGVAYLAARVRLKLDAQYPLFTQQLLDVLFPGWLDPSPSACVLRFQPDLARGEVAQGAVIPRGTAIRGSLRTNASVNCDFETTRDLELLPLRIGSVQYFPVRPEAAPGRRLEDRPASSLRVQLQLVGEAPFSQLSLDRLPLFVTASDAFGSQLMELLGGRCLTIGVSGDAGAKSEITWLPGEGVRQIGFEQDESMFRVPIRGHAGFRVLKEYAAFPDKFRFVEVCGLASALRSVNGRTLNLHFHFSTVFPQLEGAVKSGSLALFCVPAVNLRQRQLDRVDLAAGLTEYHVVADKMRPRDFEIVSLVEVIGGGRGVERKFKPIFETVSGGHGHAASFFTVRRERRRLTQEERAGYTVTYPGTESFISLSEPGSPPFGQDLQYLSIRAMCSNRGIPLQLRAQFADAAYEPLDSLPVLQVDCVAGPSIPISSPVDGFDPWIALSHLFVNYLSLCDAEPGESAGALRAMLGLYAVTPGHFLARQAEGLMQVRASQITRRVPSGGPLSFGRGVAIRLEMSDRAFDGGSPFLLAAALENFLGAHVAINSFVETHLDLVDRAETLKWQTRFGRRPTF